MKAMTMNMQKLTTWALVAGAAAVLLAGPALEHEDTRAAPPPERRQHHPGFERDYRACMKALGPNADLIPIEGTDNFVCRKVDIEPAPAELLHRYATLGVTK